MTKIKQKYWYEVYITECVLCGRTDSYKERRYTEKPEDPSKRIHYKQDACGKHFC